MKALITALMLAAPALTAQSLTEMRPQEAARLEAFHDIAGAALIAAFADGDEADRAALSRALSGRPDIAFDPGLTGDWACRTLKLGGAAGLTVYSPFKCRISFAEGRYRFEKLSGSQLTLGTLGLREGRAVYLGVGYAAGKVPPTYADLGPNFTGDGGVQPDVGLFERVSNSRARILFPAPPTDSDLDILELTR